MTPLAAEELGLRGAIGLALAEEVRSPLDLPPWDNSSMDGYAVRASDVHGASREQPVELPVAATVPAGHTTPESLRPGTAIRIMTGAPVPAGADTVIRVEDTDAGASRVRIHSDRDAGRNIRPRAEDVERGEVVARPGDEVTPALLGLLASIGKAAARVHRRPRIVIVSSGDELVDVERFDEVLAGRRIVSSNAYTIEAAARAMGAEVIASVTLPDDPVAIRERITSAECDLLLTTGGVSVGAYDHTRRVLEELGATLSFWRARIRPGAPIGFGLLRQTPWIGLPGNPVSALVTFEVFAKPAIRRLMGFRAVHPCLVPVTLAEPITLAAPLTHFLRAVITPGAGGLSARLTGPQGSGLISSMARANGLLVVGPERMQVAAGASVPAILPANPLWSETPSL